MALLSITIQRSRQDMLIPRDRTAYRLFCSSGCCLALFPPLFLLLFSSTLGAQVSYRNPVPRTFEYTFELAPDPAKINRSEDLKLWIPAPREWDSQKNVRILSVEPKPHATFEDPENGIPILYWDFAKVPEAPVYTVKMRYRLESYEVHAEINPEKVGAYDKSSELYKLYTRSTYTTTITPEVKKLAAQAVENEQNPFLQAKRINEFVNQKIRYKMLLQEGRSGIQALLNFPITDSKTGEQYYEGACSQYSVFFVALCRSLGIPARSVTAFYATTPWLKAEDLKTDEIFEKITPEGLAAAKIYGITGHSWSEFYLPNYGWIPADPTRGSFGVVANQWTILSKGSDFLIGPNAPQGNGNGYGIHWMPLHDGRADIIGSGVWNLARVRNAKAYVVQQSDPFPADALGEYLSHLYPESKPAEQLKEWREASLTQLYNAVANADAGSSTLTVACERDPQLRNIRQALLCHLLRRALGDNKFSEVEKTYLHLRTSKSGPVPTSRFREIAERVHGSSLDWFFSRWLTSDELPSLMLKGVSTERTEKGWAVRGQIVQKDLTRFEAPVELSVTTKQGDTQHKKIWLVPGLTSFEVQTSNRPECIEVDPEFDLPIIRKMPPLLSRFWDAYPDLVVIYGTAAEAAANKAAAEWFNNDYVGLEGEVIKVDTNVREEDLQKKVVFLFGRPETNRIAQRMADKFPVQFRKQSFVCQGVTYDLPDQAVALVVESPFRPGGLVILYAGNSAASTQEIHDSNVYDKVASYVVIQAKKELTHGDWKTDDGLRWKSK